jgi:hypothetical protein
MNIDCADLPEKANKAVKEYVLKEYRRSEYWQRERKHLQDCEDASIELLSASDGAYGCDTGCEYFRIDTVISCIHGYREEYEHGDFGDLLNEFPELS